MHLLHKKHEITVFDSLVGGHKASLPNIHFVKGCLSDTALLDRTFAEGKFDAVLHLAGFIEAGESMQKPEKYFQNNTVNGFNLLNAMIKHNVKRLFMLQQLLFMVSLKKCLLQKMLKKCLQIITA